MKDDWFEGRRLDDELDRCVRRRFVAWPAIVAGLFLGAAVIVAHAAEVFRSQDDKGGAAYLRLSEEPCSNEAVQEQLQRMQIAPHFLAQFKRATLFYWGREWASCWIDYNGQVLSVDEQGAPFQPVPRAAFKDERI